MVHPLMDVLDRLEAVLAEAGLEGGVAPSALSDAELELVARRAWGLAQRVQGAVLVPAVAEADERRLFRREAYASASSMRDLVAGWLRCDPGVAGRLLELGKRCVSGGFRATGAALAAGEIDADHARAVVSAVRRLPAGVMTEQDYRQAESTMLDAARATDAAVVAVAGRRLLEVLAPDAAQEYADRQAERDRQRAEESRWFEVTGVGIAGCKELRLRAESAVIDGFVRVMTGLVEESVVGPSPAGPATFAPTTFEAGTLDTSQAECSTTMPPGAGSAAGVWASRTEGLVEDVDGGPAGWAEGVDGNVADVADVAGATSPPGVAEVPGIAGQTPGLVAEGGLSLAPIERRRADAAVEVIDAITCPDLLDDLTSAQLRWLADQLENRPESAVRMAGLKTTDPTDVGDAAVNTAAPDPAFTEIVDAGQVAVDTCNDGGDIAAGAGDDRRDTYVDVDVDAGTSETSGTTATNANPGIPGQRSRSALPVHTATSERPGPSVGAATDREEGRPADPSVPDERPTCPADRPASRAGQTASPADRAAERADSIGATSGRADGDADRTAADRAARHAAAGSATPGPADGDTDRAAGAAGGGSAAGRADSIGATSGRAGGDADRAAGPAAGAAGAAGGGSAAGRAAGHAAGRGGSGSRVRGQRPSLVVIANYDQQNGRPRSGEVNSTGAPTRLASATEIERLACEATITPVWMTGNTTPVTVAAPTRFFRGKQLAALIARDRGCAFPGCSRGLRYAHAHHIVKWSQGGPTTVDNGVLLCAHHHRIIHRTAGWRIRLATDRLPEFIPPAWIDPQRRPQRHARHRTRLPAAA